VTDDPVGPDAPTTDTDWWADFVHPTGLEGVPGADGRLSLPVVERDHLRSARVRLIRTAPGSGSPRGLHTHAFEQVFVILEGGLTVQIDDRRRPIGVGDQVVFPAGREHGSWNDSDVPALHLAINLTPEDTR
jgi:quercetin dioxygenase-like cupin family protein